MENDPDHFVRNRLGWLVLFGIAMGLLEAIVVVYLRELYFPHGFRFPLQSMPQRMVTLELLREACTIIMLAAVAAVSVRTLLQRSSVFLIAFGVWDIFYYVFLKLLLGWPDSLLTWDVLFLIPVTWLGPVLAPLVCSVIMIAYGLLCINLRWIHGTVESGLTGWLLLASGAVLFCSPLLRILCQSSPVRSDGEIQPPFRQLWQLMYRGTITGRSF